MSWSVGIRLRPGSSLIETDIRLSNRTALPHPYYFWANAAVPARHGMRMVYPCSKVRTWGGLHDWPVENGRDLATYDSYEHQCDVFGLDGWEDFFGVYYEDLDFGVVHVADVRDCFGKKMFTWGTSEEGRTWSSILSDGDGPYCEIQSGRFVDQATFRLFPPHHTLEWREYWYAVKGTGTFGWANQEAAVRLATHDGQADCGVLATRPFANARVRLLSGNQVVHERGADLAPDRPLHFQTPVPAGACCLAVLDAGGREVIRYEEDADGRAPCRCRDAPKPAEPPTAGDLVRQGVFAEEHNEPQKAKAAYEKALQADPACAEAKLALGRLLLRGRPPEAATMLAEASALAPESAEVSFYLGLALSRSGEADGAGPELWKAAADPAFAHAARIELGLLVMQREDWADAVRILAAADSCTVHDLRARCLLAATFRRGGEAGHAWELMRETQGESVVDRLVWMESYFSARAAGKEAAATRALNALVKMLPPQADPWLELATDYASAGLVAEAREVLDLGVARVKVVGLHPLVNYARAYWEDDAVKAAELRRQAAGLSPKYVFPYHHEWEAALRAADPDDPHAAYYLGLLLYAQGRREEGQAAWEQAAAADPEFYILFRNLGLSARQVSNDAEKAEQWLRRAVELRPDDVRPYLELNEVFRTRRTSPEIRLAVLDAALPNVQRRGSIAAAQIDACLDLGDWDRALEELASHTFHRWEGEFGMRAVWVNVNLGQGAERFDAGDYEGARESFLRALEYPSNLRIGRHARKLDARTHWCAGAAYEALGDLESATRHWEEAAAELPQLNRDLAQFYGTSGPDIIIYRALALRKLGRSEEAEQSLSELVEQLQTRSPGEEVATAFFLGAALKALGRNEEALAALKTSLNLYAWQPRARRLLTSDVIL